MAQARSIPFENGYLGEVWALRYFWRSLVQTDLRNRYKRSVLGVGWSLLHPMAMTAVICICFRGIFDVSLREYVPFLMSGMAFWAFVAGTTSEGCNAFFHAHGFIKSVRVPLAIYPLRVVLGTMFHFLIVLATTIVVCGVFKGFDGVLPLFSLIPTLAILMLLGWAVATIMAFATVHFPDLQHISTIALQLLFYLTPVIYPPEIITSQRIATVLKLNPLTYLLELIRDPVLHSQFPSASAYVVALLLLGGTMLGAVAATRRCERRLVFALL
ncbi:MAG: ABC transporter permease [Pirellulales bacterium]